MNINLLINNDNNNYQINNQNSSNMSTYFSLDNLINQLYSEMQREVINRNGNVPTMDLYRKKVRATVLKNNNFETNQKEFIITSVFTKFRGLYIGRTRENISSLVDCMLVEKLASLELFIQTKSEEEKNAEILKNKNNSDLCQYICRVILNYEDEDESIMNFLLSCAEPIDLAESFIFALCKESKSFNLIFAKLFEDISLVEILIEGSLFYDPRLIDFAAKKIGYVPNPHDWIGILKEAGIDFSNIESSLLFQSVKSSNIHMLAALLLNGAPENIVDTNGHSLLFYAAQLANFQVCTNFQHIKNVIQLLIQRGANVNLGYPKPFELIIDYLDNTTNIQTKNFLLELLQIFLQKANIVDYLIHKGENIEINNIKYFIACGVDVNACSLDGTTTLLSWALSKQNDELTKFLLAHGANPNFCEGSLIKKSIMQLDEENFRLLVKDNQRVASGEIPVIDFAIKCVQSLTNDFERTKLKNMITSWLDMTFDPTVTAGDKKNWSNFVSNSRMSIKALLVD